MVSELWDASRCAASRPVFLPTASRQGRDVEPHCEARMADGSGTVSGFLRATMEAVDRLVRVDGLTVEGTVVSRIPLRSERKGRPMTVVRDYVVATVARTWGLAVVWEG